jgi:hypothetical protein
VALTEIQFTSSTTAGRGGAPGISTFPRAYQVQVSPDGTSWGAPIAEGTGAAGVNTITFTPVSTKFVRITQTATVPDAPAWSMRLLRLYQAPR